ncbi:MAG: 4-(cytidine 5'-diphospho)-2-C-methyl-D-erythritol kinase [Gemmatimonadaceae bacterium]
MVAQAKLNLFLRVLGRDQSGYHSLETLFQRLTLGDDVAVRVDVVGRTLDCRGADTGPVERNLAWRAAAAYADAAGWPAGFAIEVDKRIPVGGGLGGGSADAGSVLRLLDFLAPAPLGDARLRQLAVGLGADVPFLAGSAPRALAWGRGERLLALPALPSAPVALILPSVGVATADAFRWLSADRGDYRAEARQIDIAALAHWAGVVALAGNDLEAPVAARVPAVSDLLALRLRLLVGQGSGDRGDATPPDTAPLYAMTGSGSTWFLLAPGGDPTVALDGIEAAGGRVVRTATAENVVAPERMV